MTQDSPTIDIESSSTTSTELDDQLWEWSKVLDRLAARQRQVMEHPVYEALTPGSLPCFMEHHVFAVLDFMWLLKSLQVSLTSTEIAWTPQGEPTTRRFINEIVLGEESDEVDGQYVSHFDLYVQAMREVGADVAPVLRCVDDIRAGVAVEGALASCAGPPAAVEFSLATWRLASTGQLHERVAAFAFGREELIPEMFTRLLDDRGTLGSCRAFRRYLERHIEVDGDLHGPMALALVKNACGQDPDRWADAEVATAASLRNRARLWDAVVAEVEALPA